MASLLCFFALFFTADALAKAGTMSDEQVKQQIIKESISAYPGNCPCPFNSARNGSRCGKRSAWSREGGYAPICYADEISDQMIADWRRNRGAS
ncbi:hypothetical protein [Edaphovirga cremea]|uniref:hypothetical protein n=1 Tax=Edaphovirga cremea TaxID=2267246 RepID=UPI003CCC5130